MIILDKTRLDLSNGAPSLPSGPGATTWVRTTTAGTTTTAQTTTTTEQPATTPTLAPPTNPTCEANSTALIKSNGHPVMCTCPYGYKCTSQSSGASICCSKPGAGNT